MSIFQDWEPVVLRKQTKKIQYNNNKSKIIEDDGEMPEPIQKYPVELITALKSARQAKGITQIELAKKLNIPSSIINDIENNKSPYNRTIYSKLMKTLGVDLKSINFPKK